MAADALRDEVARRLRDLPPEALREVREFVESLHVPPAEGEDPALEAAGVLSGRPVSSRELDEALYGEESA